MDKDGLDVSLFSGSHTKLSYPAVGFSLPFKLLEKHIFKNVKCLL